MQTIPAKDVCKYFNHPDYIIIDIRESEDYKKGHIPCAINIPYDDFEAVEGNLPKDKTYVLYCDRGGSSLLLGRALDRKGYEVLSVSGGMLYYRGQLAK